MTENDVLNAVLTLKIENCEGYDRIPQRVLIDGLNELLKPLTKLFNTIYTQRSLPEQWLFAKITPVPKKGLNPTLP